MSSVGRASDYLARVDSHWARIAIVVVLTVLVAALDLRVVPLLDAAFLYLLPIILACVWLEQWGLLFVPITLALDYWDRSSHVPQGHYSLLGDTLIRLASFSLMAAMTRLAQSQYRRLRATQQDLARTLAEVQERQRQLDDQLEIARGVQAAVLSVTPLRCSAGRLDVAVFHSSLWHVGGDLLRVLPDSRGATLIIGDVMGKGVAAGLLMTMMTAALTSPASPASDPSDVLSEANRVLVDNVKGFFGFVTVFYAHVTHTDARMVYATAGHPSPLLVHADGEWEFLSEVGVPLGILGDTSYVASERKLLEGDRLVLYTDGITEARNGAGELFSSERLLATVLAHRAESPPAIEDAIIAAVQAFQGDAPPKDDTALIIVGVTA